MTHTQVSAITQLILEGVAEDELLVVFLRVVEDLDEEAEKKKIY
jgi:hypothetical protein